MKLLSLFCLIFLISCDARRSETAGNSRTAYEERYCREIIPAQSYGDSLNYNRAIIQDVRVADNCLCLRYDYSGCTEGEVVLSLQEGEISREKVAQARAMLWVRNAGLCEQLLSDSACFSLKRIYLKGDEVQLSLNGGARQIMIKAPPAQY